ncbi:hypothetical protein CIB48_g11291 [Xylaria polymorpha]|nr:hypothetical protein CIB48_g11291 [Xylaria polymorpha]
MRSIIFAAACATVAHAHGTVSGFVTDGTWNQGFLLDYYYLIKNGGTPPAISAWYAEDLDNGFAGGSIQFQWTVWPHDTGPVLTYVAACDGDCAAADKTALKWVKISEEGWDATASKWASGKLIDNNSTWTTTVPSTLAPGNYVFRHEIIALHGASSANGAQNYPQCFNIAITGSGTDKPEGTLGINLYTATDPPSWNLLILDNIVVSYSTRTQLSPATQFLALPYMAQAQVRTPEVNNHGWHHLDKVYYYQLDKVDNIDDIVYENHNHDYLADSHLGFGRSLIRPMRWCKLDRRNDMRARDLHETERLLLPMSPIRDMIS